MPQTRPAASIVILNWNSRGTVLQAAQSALAQEGVDVDLIIVDNGSTDGSLAELHHCFPRARFIELGTNTGFTGGINAGTAAAQHEYVVWQNADLLLSRNYLADAITELNQDHELGAVGGTVFQLREGKRTSDFYSAGFTVTPTHRPAFFKDYQRRDVVGVTGSCPVFRIAALRSVQSIVGYVLDPWYFAYGEDIDLMIRLNLAGWRVRYLPTIRAWHVGSGSTVPMSRFYEKPNHIQQHHFKNRLATIAKTLPTRVLLRRMPVLVATEVLLPFYLLLHRPRSIINWWGAWSKLVGELGRVLRDRRAIFATATAGAVARTTALLSH